MPTLLLRRRFRLIEKSSAFLGFAILWIVAGVVSASAQSSVTLAWNANPEGDLAGYRVHFGATDDGFTSVLDVGTATSAVVSGLVPATSYDFAVQAYNTAGGVSALSGVVSYVTMPGGAFGEWAAAGSLSGADALPGADPHGDGVPNLLKYAFHMNPAGPDRRILTKGGGTAGLPLILLERGSSGAVFRIEFLRRKSGGLGYVPEISTDLEQFTPLGGTAVIAAIDSEWERVVIEAPVAPQEMPRLFGRVRVVLP